jgi:hypothetical protein
MRTSILQIWQQIKARAVFWKDLFTTTILAVYVYVFMEWLFFVTMPSFMSQMSLFEKVGIFFISSLGFSLYCMAIIAFFIYLDIIGLLAHLPPIITYLEIFIPTVILFALALILIDNFTYTMFRFGISTSTGVVRVVYEALFIFLLVYIYLQLLKVFGLWGNANLGEKIRQRLFYTCLGILVVSAGLVLANLDLTKILPSVTSSKETSNAGKLPNIILLGSDGLNAENLSVYGYGRETTPRLAQLAQSSLVADNAFSNAGRTAGSVISIMTSKLSTQTRVLFPPDILTGIDSYQHLPGILKSLGYKTVEYGTPYYIDAYIFNLQNGFDVVNNHTNEGKFIDSGQNYGLGNEVYFLSRIAWRLFERILHIFLIREMQNPFDLVTNPVSYISDVSKIDQLLSQLDQSDTPVFIHAHLLGTHGGLYNPQIRIYSIDKEQNQPWMTDFYDDTILAFDSHVGKVIDHLQAHGEFENTILIIYTDHSQNFMVNERIPLIIHFPGGARANRITQNVQNMDIAPTILDYLEVNPPDWMDGESLLKGDLSDQRLIFSTGTVKGMPDEQGGYILDPELTQPPFFQFSFFDVIDCQKWYSIDLTTFEWTSGEVSGYVNPCDQNSLSSFDEIKQAVANQLEKDGFDISTLP